MRIADIISICIYICTRWGRARAPTARPHLSGTNWDIRDTHITTNVFKSALVKFELETR